MADLIEIVFEDLSNDILVKILSKYILPESNIKNFNFFENEKNIKNVHQLMKIINEKSIDELKLFINLKEIKNNFIKAKSPSIYILKEKTKYNFTFIFQTNEIDYLKKNLSTSLFEFSKVLAKEFHISIYYGGLEPAIDKDTRIFTNDALGPLIF